MPDVAAASGMPVNRVVTLTGRSILHYRILQKIGQGGMGVVYKAEDTKLKRTVALKFLSPYILSSDEEKERFVNEARSAAALHHPNICTVYEINEADDQTFISMAFLEGEGLNERIGRGPLKPVDALRIALQIARGLRAAHEKGIIHRDIKSSNIMIDDDGRATIMDFGLAKSVHQTHETHRGMKMGTIAYMSPEQTRGDAVDHRTDIWSLGILMYEMVTGRRPFRGDYDEAVIYSILNEEPQPVTAYVPDVPEDVSLAIQRAMAKDPQQRYQTAAEMAEDLEVLYDDIRTGSSSRRRKLRTGTLSGSAGPAGPPEAEEPVTRSFVSSRTMLTLIVYLLAVWAAVRMTGWVVDKFVLSTHLVSIVMVGLLSAIPTVMILSARNGSRGRYWPRITAIGIPANALLSVVLLLALFAGRDLGAATETVTVLDESGHRIERIVPKSEFRKSLLVYFFNGEDGDPEDIWVGGGLMALLQVDLFQDSFLYLRSCIENSFMQRLQKAGFEDWFDAPWSLKRETAEAAHIDYLVTGSYGRQSDAWRVTVRVHESETGRLVSEHVYVNEDLFALADEASVQLRRDMGLPDGHIEATQDLPIAEMFTGSMPALRDMCLAIYSALFEQDWLGAVGCLERAVEADSTFAWGYFTLFEFYQAANVADKADPAIRAAMQHSYKLPERMRFVLKVNYYTHVQDPDKAFGVARMMVELDPEDIIGNLILAELHRGRNERSLAIEQYKKALAIDPSRTEFLEAIGDLYRNMGDFDRAIESFEAYTKTHPNDATAYESLGSVYEAQGEFEEAKQQYERALVLDPSLVRVMVDLADIEGKLSHDALALKKYDEALTLAKTPQDRARVYRSTRYFYSNRGRMSESLDQVRLFWAEKEKYLPPVAVEIEKMDDLCLFVRAGRTQEAFEILQSIEGRLVPPFDGLIPLGYLCIYAELEDPDETETALEKLQVYIDTNDVGHLRGEAYWGRAKIAEARGDYREALEYYQLKVKEDPNDFLMYPAIGRCYRKLGQYDAAVTSIEKMLRSHPLNPTANYEMALVQYDLGDHAKAMQHLQKSLDRLKDAYPDYKLAQNARATLAAWE